MPNTPIAFDEVEIVDITAFGRKCRIDGHDVFVGWTVPLRGTLVDAMHDVGRLVLPRWFVEQERLALKA